MYFLIGSFGGPQPAVRGGEVPPVQPGRRPAHAGRASSGCTSYSASGTGHHGTFLISQLVQVPLTPTTQKWLFLGFFIAFAIKAPLCAVPHLAARRGAEAPPGGAVLLVGVLDKVGTFGMIRLLPAAVPGRVAGTSPRWSWSLAVIGILYGAFAGDRPDAT